ncbi:hypothetical protein H8959_004003 [Pygathrix nigripes]
MRRAAPSVRARVLLGHAVEGDAALCRLRGPGQLGLPERGVSPWVRPPSPSSPKGRPRAAQHRRCLRRPQVQKQETWVFLAYGVGVGLWLVISSLPRRRLVLNHTRGVYHFSIQGRTVCQGPLHLVYVRLALNSDGDWPGGWARDGEAAWEVRGAVRPADPLSPQPTEGASSSWSSAATGWSRWCWCSCRSATSKWNTWAVTSPGNSTSTTSTTWPPPTGTWFATGHPLAPVP